MKESIYIANFIKRSNAYLLDFGMTILFIFMCAFTLMGWLQKVILILGLYLLIFLIPCLNQGQSIGKLIFKLKPLHLKSHTPLAWWEIQLRELTKYSLFILTFGLSHIISYFMCSERSDHRTLHDLIFKTEVIDLKPQIKNYEANQSAEDDYYQNYQTQRTIR